MCADVVSKSAGVKLYWHKEQPPSCFSLEVEDVVDYFRTQKISRRVCGRFIVVEELRLQKALSLG